MLPASSVVSRLNFGRSQPSHLSGFFSGCSGFSYLILIIRLTVTVLLWSAIMDCSAAVSGVVYSCFRSRLVEVHSL